MKISIPEDKYENFKLSLLIDLTIQARASKDLLLSLIDASPEQKASNWKNLYDSHETILTEEINKKYGDGSASK